MWLAWTIAAYALNAVSVSIDKALFYTKQIKRPAAYVVTICTLGLMVLVLARWGFAIPSMMGMGLSILTGICFVGGLWLLFIALQHGEASRVTSFIGAWSPIFVLIATYWLLGDKLSWNEFYAFALLVAGGFLIASGKGGLDKRGRWLSLGSAFGFALFYTLSKEVFNEIGFINGLIWIRITSFSVAMLLFFIPHTWAGIKESMRAETPAKFAFFGGQAASALSSLLINYAISLGSVALVNALQGLQYVFLLMIVALLSFNRPKLLKEELAGQILVRKLLAILLIGGGLAFIAYS